MHCVIQGDWEELLTLIGAMLDGPTWQDLDIEQRIIVEELQDELDEEGRDIDVDNVAKLALMPGCGGGRKLVAISRASNASASKTASDGSTRVTERKTLC